MSINKQESGDSIASHVLCSTLTATGGSRCSESRSYYMKQQIWVNRISLWAFRQLNTYPECLLKKTPLSTIFSKLFWCLPTLQTGRSGENWNWHWNLSTWARKVREMPKQNRMGRKRGKLRCTNAKIWDLKEKLMNQLRKGQDYRTQNLARLSQSRRVTGLK